MCTRWIGYSLLGQVRVTFSNGEVWEGRLHNEWTLESLELFGFLMDLKHAYRLCPRRASQRALAFIAYWNAEVSGVELGEHLGQPFGGSACVNNFLRLGAAIRNVLEGSLFFVLTQFLACGQLRDEFTELKFHSRLNVAKR